MSWLFLAGAALCGIGAYAIGMPAWTSYRQREAIDSNAERYLAWRGRAPSPGSEVTRERPTAAERRRIWLAGMLAGAALALLITFLVTT
jgi:ABC-type branched-subunit amino acid transport system permease subunit